MSKNYVYVIDASESTGDVEAKVLFPDGTVAKIDVDGTIEKFNGTGSASTDFEVKNDTDATSWRESFLPTRRTARMSIPLPSRPLTRLLSISRPTRPASTPPAWTIRTPLSTRWT